MKTTLCCGLGFLFLFAATPHFRADQVEMQNGDRYVGKVLSVSADTVVLESEVLGKVSVPRKKVANLSLAATAAAPKPVTAVTTVSTVTNISATASPTVRTNSDISAALRNLGANENFVQQIREQMLAGAPEAANKYQEMVNSLMAGNLNVSDIRRQAKASADQLRALRKDLGPEGESLDGYLEVLEGFLKEPATESVSAPTRQKRKVVSPPSS